MPTNIGYLDTKIVIQQSTMERDEVSKDKVLTWGNYVTLWAALVSAPKGERTEANNRVAVNEVRFRTRYKSGVTEKMRVVYDGDNYYITGVEVKGRKESLVLITEKRDSENA